jgi:uncharacterized protein
VHKLCQDAAPRILADFTPTLMIAIGGGGYVPARILRSFLKKPGNPNIPIQAIGLSLYESLPTDSQVEAPGTKVTRTQWLDLSSLEMANLIGKNVLIVDEVDDTRTTLEYAVKELEKDVATAAKNAGREGEMGSTKFSIFVLHNKDKEKRGVLPKDMISENRYLAARTVPDVWINYPWEATYVGHVMIENGSSTNWDTATSTSTIAWLRSRRFSRLDESGCIHESMTMELGIRRTGWTELFIKRQCAIRGSRKWDLEARIERLIVFEEIHPMKSYIPR